MKKEIIEMIGEFIDILILIGLFVFTCEALYLKDPILSIIGLAFTARNGYTTLSKL